jgi:hypothetical protein
LLSLDQFKSFFGRRNDGLLQHLEIAERTLTLRWGCSAGEFQDDQRMAQY